VGKVTLEQVGPAVSKLQELQQALDAAEAASDQCEQQRDEEKMSVPKEANPNFPHYAFDGGLDRDSAAAMIRGRPDGTFLLRQKEGGVWSLCVIFRGEATHHAITAVGGGVLQVNGAPMARHTTLEALVNHMRTPLQNWPVQLVKPVKNSKVQLPVRSTSSEARLAKIQTTVKRCREAVAQQQKQVDMLTSLAGMSDMTTAPAVQKTDAELTEILKRALEDQGAVVRRGEEEKARISARLAKLITQASDSEPSKVRVLRSYPYICMPVSGCSTSHSRVRFRRFTVYSYLPLVWTLNVGDDSVGG
jgi:hypothetical protein